jgi:hypothetical protein
MYTLGINAVFHDSSAALVHDGRVVAAAEEERFTRVKHGKRPVPFSTYELPFHAIDYCLRHAGIRLVDVGHVAYAFDPAILLGERRADATITLPLEPSAQAARSDWESVWEPLFLSYVVNAPQQMLGVGAFAIPSASHRWGMYADAKFRFDSPGRGTVDRDHGEGERVVEIASPAEHGQRRFTIGERMPRHERQLDLVHVLARTLHD